MKIDKDTTVVHKTIRHTLLNNCCGEFEIVATSEIWNGHHQNNFTFAIFLNKHLVHTGYYRTNAREDIWEDEAKKTLRHFANEYTEREERND
jgi:hypothetical protein